MYQDSEQWERFIGKQIKTLRIRKELTQSELAERSGLSLASIANIEQGKGSSLKTLVSILNVLGETAWLESLAPEVEISPIQLVELGKERQRVRRKAVDQ